MQRTGLEKLLGQFEEQQDGQKGRSRMGKWDTHLER